jgi:hypothetical protein
MVGKRPTSSSAGLLTKSLNAGEPTSTEAASTVKLVWLFVGRSKSISRQFLSGCQFSARRFVLTSCWPDRRTRD